MSPFMFIFPTRTIILIFVSMSTYSQMAAANPYRNAEYKKSFWQRVGSALGFRTEADAWKENMNIQANEYDAQIAQMQFQNEYNSPAEQASRMRVAGQNPDLLGTGDVASAASPFDDPSTPMQSTGDEGKIASAVKMVFDCATAAVGIANGFGQLQALKLANEGAEVDNSEKVSKLAKWVFGNVKLPYDKNVSERDNTILQESILDGVAQEIRLPKRFRNQFRQSLTRFGESLNEQLDSWESQEKLGSARLSNARLFESKYFDDGSIDSMRIVNKHLINMSDKLAELSKEKETAEAGADIAQAGAERAEANYNKEYYSNLSGEEAAAAQNAKNSNERLFAQEFDPLAAAGAQNAQNVYSEQISRVDKIINDSLSDMVHDLDRRAKRGDVFAQSMLFSFNLARMAKLNFSPTGLSLGLNASLGQ